MKYRDKKTIKNKNSITNKHTLKKKTIKNKKGKEGEYFWKKERTLKLKEVKEKIMKIYLKNYEDVGILYYNFDDLVKNNPCSYGLFIYEKNKKEPVGFILYWLSVFGNKISVVITKDKTIATEYIIPKLIELLNTRGFWGEFNMKLEYLLRKNGLNNIKNHTIIKTVVKYITDDDIFTEDDERRKEYPLHNDLSPVGSYLRKVGILGIKRKAIYGMPCLSKKYDSLGCNRKCIE